MIMYLTKQLSSKEKRQVTRYLRQYKKIDAIIQSKQMDLMPNITSTLNDIAVQTSNGFHSEAEEYTIKVMEIDEYVRIKKKLDLAYNSVKDVQRIIWDEHYIEGHSDTDVYYGNDINKRTYYREKRELILLTAEILNIGTKTHQ